MNELEFHHTVSYSDADAFGMLSPARILEMNQDCLASLVASFECDNPSLKKRLNAAWMFARSTVFHYRDVEVSRTVRMVSRLACTTAFSADFHTDIISSDGNVVATIFTVGCIFSFDRRRLLKLVDAKVPVVSGEVKVQKSTLEMDTVYSYSLEVKPSMLDYTRHLNNTKCLPIVMDSLSLDEGRKVMAVPYEMILGYRNQAMENETIDVFTGRADSSFIFQLKRRGDVVVEGRISRLEEGLKEQGG